VASGGGVERIAPFSVEVVSSLGAGDVFHGALLAGLVRELGLADAVKQANWVAAQSCTSIDGRSGIPRLAAVEQFFKVGAGAVTMG
jgi:sulfofructose kinase